MKRQRGSRPKRGTLEKPVFWCKEKKKKLPRLKMGTFH
jgi:hypothetical protein